jgi:hypothetical protein
MGWFVIACICGFLGHRGWQSLLQWSLEPNKPEWRKEVPVFATFFAFLIFSVGLVVWAVLAQDARTPGQVADALQTGRVARFLLGLIVGAGAVLAWPERTRGGSGGGGSTWAPPRSSIEGDGGDLPTYQAFSIGLAVVAIVVLALASPHVDRWLSHLTVVKSPYVELQLAGASTHKLSVTEGLEKLQESDGLQYLIDYDDKIHLDIELLKLLQDEKNSNSTGDLLKSAQNIDGFFHIIKSTMQCIQSGVKKNWLSMESAREKLKPTTQLFEKIVFGKGILHGQSQSDLNDKFWLSLLELQNDIAQQVGEWVEVGETQCRTPIAEAIYHTQQAMAVFGDKQPPPKGVTRDEAARDEAARDEAASADARTARAYAVALTRARPGRGELEGANAQTAAAITDLTQAIDAGKHKDAKAATKHLEAALKHLQQAKTAPLENAETAKLPKEVANTLPSLPCIRDHTIKSPPYLYVTGALLISFAGDSAQALRVLDEAHRLPGFSGDFDFDDLIYLWLVARLRYYNHQNQTGPIWNTYLHPLVTIRNAARDRIQIIEKAKVPIKCTDKDTVSTNLLCRHKFAEVAATNLAAFYISEDLVRGNEHANLYRTELQEYAEEIKRAVDEAEKLGPSKDGFYRKVLEDKYIYLDTYAYAMLVLEASKPNPDYDVTMKKIIHTLETVVGGFEDRLRDQPQQDQDRDQLGTWRLAQAHLLSAREFAGE